jgi:hypothetical protein
MAKPRLPKCAIYGNASGDGMARINIEECWWSDVRRSALIRLLGSDDLADAAAIRMWRLAQEFWGRGRALVPLHIWETLEPAPNLLRAGLAEIREGGVYVRGSSQYLDWVIEQKEKARIGGKNSADARRKKYGSAQPKAKKPRTKPEPTPKPLEVSDSGSNSGSGFGSNSGSIANFENSPTKTKSFISAYCDRFRNRWGDNPQILGKDAGIAKRLAKDLGQDRFEYLLDAFFSMPDAWLVKTKHPLGAFETKLNEIVIFAEQGEFTSQRQAQVADGTVATANLLQKIREGKI